MGCGGKTGDQGAVVSPPEAAQPPRQRRNRKAPNFSTEEFCLLYNAGYSDSEIAKRLGVTYNTVVHRRNMQLNAPPNRRKPGEPLVPPEEERISEERFERPWNWWKKLYMAVTADRYELPVLCRIPRWNWQLAGTDYSNLFQKTSRSGASFSPAR